LAGAARLAVPDLVAVRVCLEPFAADAFTADDFTAVRLAPDDLLVFR
jgi:hypothetical protein